MGSNPDPATLLCPEATDFTSLGLSLVTCQKAGRVTELQGCCRDQSGNLKEPGQAGDAVLRGGDPSKDTNEASLFHLHWGNPGSEDVL